MKTKQIIFITATNTNIGKTYASCLVLKSMAKKGFDVAYFKPIETGVKNNKPKDILKCTKLAKKLNSKLNNLPLNSFYSHIFTLPASPFVANLSKHKNKNKQTKIKPKNIINKALHLFNFCDILVIEGAGGLFVPICKNYFVIDLIFNFSNISYFNLININEQLYSKQKQISPKQFCPITHSTQQTKYQNKLKTKILLISPSNLGNINDTLLSFNILYKYKLKFKWYINLFKQKKLFKKISLPFYKQNKTKLFKKIRYLDAL
jgi:dethiobiotin synthetase